MKNRFFIKIFSAFLALMLTIPFLASCQSAPSEKAVVGTVNGEKVYYDELYYLVNGYKEAVLDEYGDDTEAARTELDRLIKENIVINYAMLALCESVGLKYSDIKKSEIDDAIENEIAVNYGDDEDAFYDNLDKSGMSERYFRYVMGLDLLCARLGDAYADEGLVLSTEKEIRDYIEKNFIRVYHLVLFNDEGDSKEENIAKMNDAKAKLENGEKIVNLVQYYEDNLITEHGYYILKGTMDESYENAAFALEVGETSDVVTAMGEHNYKTVEGYYVIQRFELDDNYVTTYFDSLKNEYYNLVINDDYHEILKELEFTPNKDYAELDLLALEKPTESANTVLIVAIVVAAVVIATAVVVIIVIKKKHKKKNISFKKLDKNTKTEKK